VEELMLVRNQWNDTGLEVPDIVPLPDLLARLARTCPDRTAVKTADRKAVCFQDLDRLADRAARYLAQTGVTPGAMTAVALTDPVHHLAAVPGPGACPWTALPKTWPGPWRGSPPGSPATGRAGLIPVPAMPPSGTLHSRTTPA
jgi:non-ribosomal peptide synthetase component F